MKKERDELLWAQAGVVYPHNENLREKWYEAILFLRQSKRGWSFDKKVTKKVDRPLLHGYVATPPMQTVTALPDEQVVPGEKVAVGPWPKHPR